MRCPICGTLKFENTSAKLGDIIPTKNTRTGVELNAPWTGWARSESIDYWIGQGRGEVVTIPAKGFVEQTHEFRVADNAYILGIVLGSDSYAHGKLQGRAGELKVVTRAAESPLEKQIHNRWPVTLIPNQKGHQVFHGEDVVNQPAA